MTQSFLHYSVLLAALLTPRKTGAHGRNEQADIISKRWGSSSKYLDVGRNALQASRQKIWLPQCPAVMNLFGFLVLPRSHTQTHTHTHSHTQAQAFWSVRLIIHEKCLCFRQWEEKSWIYWEIDASQVAG